MLQECKGAVEAARKLFEGLPEECKTLSGGNLDDSDPTVDCVVSHLPLCAVLHLACTCSHLL